MDGEIKEATKRVYSKYGDVFRRLAEVEREEKRKTRLVYEVDSNGVVHNVREEVI